MAALAMFFGVLLTILGIVLYGGAGFDPKAITALIPAALGVLLVLLGLIARAGSERTRMHTMHAAALIGLIGLAGGAVRTIMALVKFGTDQPPSSLALGGNITMAVLCGIFLALCVKSFIDVRRARKRAATAPTATGTGPNDMSRP